MELLRALDPHSFREEWLLAAIALLTAVGLMLATRVVAPKGHRVQFTSAIIFLFMSLFGFLGRQIATSWPDVASFFTGFAILFYALAVARALFLFGFDGVLMRNRRDPLPRILRDIAQGALFFFALLVGLRGAGVAAGQLLTTSAVISVVAGMALQETLGNLVAGLAMQGERPFEVGDWIEIHGSPGSSGQIGTVREINWRATRLHTLDNNDVVIPNGLLAKAVVTNFVRPHSASRRSVYFTTTADVPPRRVHNVVLEAVRGAEEVLSDPPPSMVTFAFNESGTQFWLRYFIRTIGRRDVIDGGVRDRIWYALEREAIPFAVPGRAITVHEVSEVTETVRREKDLEDRNTVLRAIDLFSPLEDSALLRLAGNARTVLFAPGETVIHRAEPGDTMFVVRSGQLSVRLADDAEVARLGPGAFFGEMSLLTGSPRQATVVALDSCELLELDHATMQRLLSEHPELAQKLSEKVTQRRSDNLAKEELSAMEQKRAVEPASDDVLDRIRSFFGLRRMSD